MERTGARTGQGLIRGLLAASGLTALAAVAAVFAFLALFASPLFSAGRLSEVLAWTWRPTQGLYGILPMALGTALLGLSATALAFPVAVGLCLFCRGLGPAFLRRPLLAAVRLMTGVPTVVYGFAAAFLLIPALREGFTGGGYSWLAAAMVLALVILPTMVLALGGQMALAEPRLRLAAAALGLTPAQGLVHLVLPEARSGLTTALVLGLGRALGDTLTALMLSGNASQVPDSFLDSIRVLTAHIALVAATDSHSAAYSSLFAAGLLLLGVSASVNLVLRRATRSGGGLS